MPYKDPEKQKAWKLAYKEKNKEHIDKRDKERQKKYYEKNKEKQIEKSRKYKESMTEDQIEKRREYLRQYANQRYKEKTEAGYWELIKELASDLDEQDQKQ